MASIIDVAKKAGVSKSTVSRYFNNGYVSEECAERIKKAIDDLSYSPSSLGRALKYNRSMTIGLCVPKISHPFFSKITEAIEDEAYALGYRLLLTDSGNDKAREESFISLAKKSQIDGIIFVTHNFYDRMDPNLPIVTIDRRFAGGVPTITSDNYEATKKALAYLWDQGARRIGFLGGKPAVTSFVYDRYRAYSDFASEHGMEERTGYYESKHGEEYCYSEKYFASFPDVDAVFATSDAYGFAYYRVLVRNGKSCDDVKIVTYDGCMNDLIQSPSFTSVVQNIPAMANKVVEVLNMKITGQKDIDDVYTIPTTFFKGETA